MNASRFWRCRDRRLDLSARTAVMGIVNVTPDSFSDGGRFLDPAAAIARCRALAAEGAELLDLGAESTRPGAEAVTPEEQWRRLEPVLAALAAEPVTRRGRGARWTRAARWSRRARSRWART